MKIRLFPPSGAAKSGQKHKRTSCPRCLSRMFQCKQKKELNEFLRVSKEYHVLLAIRDLAVNLLELAIESPETSQLIVSQQLGQTFFEEELDAAFVAEVFRANRTMDNRVLWQKIQQMRTQVVTTSLKAISRKYRKFFVSTVVEVELRARQCDHSNSDLAEYLIAQLCTKDIFKFVVKTVHTQTQNLKTPLFFAMDFSSQEVFLDLLRRAQVRIDKKSNLSSILQMANEEASRRHLKRIILYYLKKEYPHIVPSMRKIYLHILLRCLEEQAK